jgi:hypothetical protein
MLRVDVDVDVGVHDKDAAAAEKLLLAKASGKLDDPTRDDDANEGETRTVLRCE